MDYSKHAVIEELSTGKRGVIRDGASTESWMVYFEDEGETREVKAVAMKIVPGGEVAGQP